jgi:hypothetical protein
VYELVRGCGAAKCSRSGASEIETLQGRWQLEVKVGYCYPNGLEKTLCKRDIYVPLVTKGLMFISILLLSEGQNNVAWKPSDKAVFFQRSAGFRQESTVVSRSSGLHGVRGGTDYRESGRSRGNS